MSIDVTERADQAVRDVLALPAHLPLLPDSNLFELGLDSMNVVELFLRLEGDLGLQLDVDDLRPELFERLGNLHLFLAERRQAA